jgi:hypothetical protein
MSTPHKWSKEIHAWADGAEIQYYEPMGNQWLPAEMPSWYEHIEYRIKPDPLAIAIEALEKIANDLSTVSRFEARDALKQIKEAS